MTRGFLRPADLALPPGGWNSTRAKFDLSDLSAAESAGVLLQWALSRHLGAELKRAGYTSVEAFARVNQLPNSNTLHNFFNGNRRANFEDLALLVERLGPKAWPQPSRLARYIEGARRRSGGEEAAGPLWSLYQGDLDAKDPWDEWGR